MGTRLELIARLEQRSGEVAGLLRCNIIILKDVVEYAGVKYYSYNARERSFQGMRGWQKMANYPIDQVSNYVIGQVLEWLENY